MKPYSGTTIPNIYHSFVVEWKNDWLYIEVSQREGKLAFGYMCQFTPSKGGLLSPGAGMARYGISHLYNEKFFSQAEAIKACLVCCRHRFVHAPMRDLIDQQIRLHTYLQLSFF